MNFINKALAEPALNFYSIQFTENDFVNQGGRHYANKIIDSPIAWTERRDVRDPQTLAVFLFDGIPRTFTVLNCKLRPDGRYYLSITC